MDDKIFDASISEIKQGFRYCTDNAAYTCLCCGKRYFEGDIYAFGDRLVDARRAAQLHIEEAHGSVFLALTAEGKKFTGLSDTQQDLITYFYKGVSDKDIAKITNTSPSTVRYQRFNLREKAKQAKIFLALSELMEEKIRESGSDSLISIHKGATMVDERYMMTSDEENKILNACFTSLEPLVLKTFEHKEKKKLVILRAIIKQFEPEKKYREREINEIIKPIYEDFVTIRRYLIQYGFLGRASDGSEYWVK